MNPLHIPGRFRKTRQGCYVRCNHCNRNITEKCGDSGKKWNTCKFGDSHRFVSKKYDPYRGRMVHLKSWPKEVRELPDFFKRHAQLIQDHEEKSIHDNERYELLSDCLAMFSDFISDEGVAEYEKKRNSEKYIKSQIQSLSELKEALKEHRVNPDFLPIEDFSKKHVDMVHGYLVARFSNKTVNNKIANYRAFFEFLISNGYPVINLFKPVKPKPVKARKEVIEIIDFQRLCESVTVEGGILFESQNSKERGKRVFRRNLHRDYLIDVWKFALFSGTRRGEIEVLKVQDVKENYINCKNLKVSARKKTDEYRLVPLTKELRELVEKLKEGLKQEDYLLAPEEINRSNMMHVCSRAFSHYWKAISDKPLALSDLRNTYATAMYHKIGSKFEGRIGLHNNISTSLINYINEEATMAELKEIKLFG